ncbi:MAG TPA: methionine ABC transporter permease [Ruminiclostridium sp.]|nr:methionine ABC transporter permease [Ruminiclostridium sp.]
MFNSVMIKMLLKGSVQTLYVSIISSVVAYLIGLPLGILLVTTEKDGLTPVTWLNKFLGVIINLLRSVPFLILVLVVQPFTRLIIGTPLGPKASIVPLVIASAPYIARLVESSIKEIDRGAIEAAQSMGASPFQIIYKVMLPEAKPSLIVGSAIAVTTIVGYSAMTGIVGGGGLGDIAIRYGLYKYQYDVMLITVVLLVIIVQIIQEVGTRMAKNMDKRTR